MDIGLFFGSFNPIHTGHVIIANHVVYHTSLDEVWLVVSPQNPFKEKHKMLDAYDRLHLVELALEGNDKLRSSNIEFNLPKPSYTIDTLTHLHEKYPQHRFSLLMGGDNLLHFHKWKNHEQIIAKHHIYVYKRPDSTPDQWAAHPQVTLLPDTPSLEISSTFIRQQIKLGFPITYLVPPAVEQYIDEMGFYKD